MKVPKLASSTYKHSSAAAGPVGLCSHLLIQSPYLVLLLLLLIPAFVPSHGRPRPLTPALCVICIAAGAQFIVLRNKRFVTICTQLLCHSSLKGEFPEKSDFSAALHSLRSPTQ